MTRLERIDTYTQIMLEADKAGGRPAIDAAERELCKRDLFYLLAYVCGRADVRASDNLPAPNQPRHGRTDSAAPMPRHATAR